MCMFSLESRLSIPDFVSSRLSVLDFASQLCSAPDFASQLCQSCETKSGTESLGLRLAHVYTQQYYYLIWIVFQYSQSTKKGRRLVHVSEQPTRKHQHRMSSKVEVTIVHAECIPTSDDCLNLAGRYLESNPQLPQYLHRLKGSCKKLFLITNSPYWFV